MCGSCWWVLWRTSTGLQIIAEIEQGLTAQRIYQDLVADYGFASEYHSVRRYVGSLVSCKELPVQRMEVEAGQEMQIDYGHGARCIDHTGKLRKTHVFRLVLSHSRKGYIEAVKRLTTESHNLSILTKTFDTLGHSIEITALPRTYSKRNG